jgi:hypothetical protein
MVNKVMLSDIDSKGKKFLRRSDLTPRTRLIIAFTALVSNQWGIITRLSRQYAVSRMFIYLLIRDLEAAEFEFFSARFTEAQIVEKRVIYGHILSFRLEGKCSIEGISKLMKRLGIANNSVGYISQSLDNIGSLLPNTVRRGDCLQLVIYASDEIFCKSQPILITVDPVSSAILRIELSDSRESEVWKAHWQCLMEHEYYSIYLVKDQGTSMESARSEILSEVGHQPDTYHAISHQLGLWVMRLEAAAYKALRQMYDRYEKLDSAVSDKVIDKRIAAYETAEEAAEKAVALYDEFHDYYLFLIDQLRLFDSKGNLRDKAQAEANIGFAIEMIASLEYPKISKITDKIAELLPELLNYFDRAKQVIIYLQTTAISLEVLKEFCLAWQYQKNRIKAKQKSRRNKYKAKEKEQLTLLEEMCGEQFLMNKELIYSQLDTIVQSSALVETINSIIRSYLNMTRNHINQYFLNLVMFYHNHRRYQGGKRKGKTPMEILTGKDEQKDWLELLFEEIEKVDPTLIAA